MLTGNNLSQKLQRIDGKSYRAYKDIEGIYNLGGLVLFIDHVQGDPFAAPSRMRIRIPQSKAGFPIPLFSNISRQTALENFLAKSFAHHIQSVSSRRGSGKSGLIQIDTPGQAVLERSAVHVTVDLIEIRFFMGLPAAGRRILGREAEEMLLDDLPQITENALVYKRLDQELIQRWVLSVEDQHCLRTALKAKNLVSFIANGSILPRCSGVSDLPLVPSKAVPFKSPPSLEVEMSVPNAGLIRGMGIPRGVTLIAGGGFHGKSTLLNALQNGVYNHIPTDGRERSVTDPTAVKIRAEDGRRVFGVNISPFINNLPFGVSTDFFCTENASGSTSQASNIIEALEAGCQLLLIDEDTSATNFLIRDHRMQELVSKKSEPITPFIDKVRQLFTESGVSTIMVFGGSGDYFDVADQVIMLEEYAVRDVTAQAKSIARKHQALRRNEGGNSFGAITARKPVADSLDASKGRRDVNIKNHGQETIQFGQETIDLSAVEQLIDQSQTRAIGAALQYAKGFMNGSRTVEEILNRVMQSIHENGLDVLDKRKPGDLAMFRRQELAAALNRLRTLRVR